VSGAVDGVEYISVMFVVSVASVEVAASAVVACDVSGMSVVGCAG
jgi:hypothetical protein